MTEMRDKMISGAQAQAQANPFEKGNWDMNGQSKIYRESPEIARYMANEAKRKIQIDKDTE